MRSWEGMEEVVAIADAGSFASAAKILHVSTSHISKVIARLEQRLETQLFNRTTRRVSLTDTGRAFADQSRRIIQERDELLMMISGSGEPQGELRISCSVTIGERFVAPIVRRFSEDHPRLSVSIDLSNRLIDLVGEGFDLAIRTGEINDSRLIARQIAVRAIETCAAPAYLKAHGTPRTIADLERHACLVGTTSTWHFQQQGERYDFRPQSNWRCNSGSAIVDAAVAGMGICQVPSFYIQEHEAAGRLVPILQKFRSAPEPVWAVYPARRHLTPKVRNLADALEAQLQTAIDGLDRDRAEAA
jgi:DNA-binding transcriptional LysR family regulator